MPGMNGSLVNSGLIDKQMGTKERRNTFTHLVFGSSFPHEVVCCTLSHTHTLPINTHPCPASAWKPHSGLCPPSLSLLVSS